MDNKILEALKTFNINVHDSTSASISNVNVVRNPVQSYSARNKNQFVRPEYDFWDIQRAQDTDSYFSKSIEKKSLKFLLAGYEFSGENPTTVEYIKKRIKQIQFASNKPFNIILLQTVQDLNRYSNHEWVFVRDENNSGGKPYKLNNKLVKPITAIFQPAFETLEFKVKDNGDIEKIKQVVPGATKRPEWKGEDTLHFYVNKRPGFTVGSPTAFSALEDMLILRRIEENVLELIESNLFPLFHYKIGTKEAPERINPKTGMREVEQIGQTLQYMPSSGVYISDWRHEITAIGSEGKALDIAVYLEYFKKRVFSAIGMSPVDMGESDTSNKSTAQTQSKSLTESVESVQSLMKTFIDHYFIVPLLLESSFQFDVLAPENIVEINFGKIDTSEQTLQENSAIQLYNANALTHEELRTKVGKRPLKPEQENSLVYHKFPDRTALAAVAKAEAAGAASSTQAQNQHGKTQKKTSSQKDYSYLLNNDLLDRLEVLTQIDINNNDILVEWINDFSDRTSALIKNRIINSNVIEFNIDILTEDGYVNNRTICDYSYKLTNSFIKNLNKKIENLDNTNVDLNTIVLTQAWRIENLIQDIESITNLETLNFLKV